jgi:hypothetical protein
MRKPFPTSANKGNSSFVSNKFSSSFIDSINGTPVDGGEGKSHLKSSQPGQRKEREVACAGTLPAPKVKTIKPDTFNVKRIALFNFALQQIRHFSPPPFASYQFTPLAESRNVNGVVL